MEEHGVTVLTNTEVTDLVQDETGRVVGVKAIAEDGGEISVGASAGVLLATGGFERNEEMVKNFQRGPLMGALTSMNNTGDGHRMAMKLGAKLGNMNNAYQTLFYPDGPRGAIDQTDFNVYPSVPGCIVVNQDGQRFFNEGNPYGCMPNHPFWNFDAKRLSFSNLYGYLIFDSTVPEAVGWPGFGNGDTQPDWVQGFDTLEELAEAFGIDPVGLAEQVERFNGYARSGVDEEFGRGADKHAAINSTWVNKLGKELLEGPTGREVILPTTPTDNTCLGPIETPPFYVARIAPGAGAGTCGGMVTNFDGQVIDVDNNVIEGLYAAGLCSSLITGGIYTGGGTSMGAGYYRAVRAANKALGIGIL